MPGPPKSGNSGAFAWFACRPISLSAPRKSRKPFPIPVAGADASNPIDLKPTQRRRAASPDDLLTRRSSTQCRYDSAELAEELAWPLLMGPQSAVRGTSHGRQQILVALSCERPV